MYLKGKSPLRGSRLERVTEYQARFITVLSANERQLAG